MQVWPMVLALSAMLMGCSCLGTNGGAPPLRAGERIVFFGDSITEFGGKPNGYVTIVQQTLDTRHPDLHLEVVNAGVSGNRVPHLLERMQKDVLDKHPTRVIVFIGINDCTLNPPYNNGTPKGEYEKGLRTIIAKAREAGAKVTLATPAVCGERGDGKNKFDAAIDAYARISEKVAADTHTPLVDLRTLFVAYEKAHNKDNKDSGVLTIDSLHMNDDGNRILADAMLQALGEQPVNKGK